MVELYCGVLIGALGAGILLVVSIFWHDNPLLTNCFNRSDWFRYNHRVGVVLLIGGLLLVAGMLLIHRGWSAVFLR